MSGIDELGVDADHLFDDTDAEFRRAYEGKDSIVVRGTPLATLGGAARSWTVTFGLDDRALSMSLVVIRVGGYLTSLTFMPTAAPELADRVLAVAVGKLTE